MPNIKSAKKRVLVNATKAAQNKAQKSALKTDLKKFEAAVAEGNRSEADDCQAQQAGLSKWCLIADKRAKSRLGNQAAFLLSERGHEP